MCTCYPIINRVSELKVHIELTRFVQPEKIEIDANERAVNEKSQYCFFVCTTFDSFLNDLNDDVLMGFDNYFDKKSKDYNSFCLDEEDINPLQNFVAQIKSADSDSVIYVSTYGYEITNSKGEKSTYADALWIDTVLPISQIERYIEKSGVAEPSNISFVGDSDECGNYKVWIIAQEENNPHIIELTDRKKIDHMIILYWD